MVVFSEWGNAAVCIVSNRHRRHKVVSDRGFSSDPISTVHLYLAISKEINRSRIAGTNIPGYGMIEVYTVASGNF